MNTNTLVADLKLLSLQAGIAMDEVTKRFRKLALQLHPDKGGDTQKFVAVRQAYERIVKHGTTTPVPVMQPVQPMVWKVYSCSMNVSVSSTATSASTW